MDNAFLQNSGNCANIPRVVLGNQDKLIVTNQNNKYYIPYVKGIIQKIDKEKGIILENISGLIE